MKNKNIFLQYHYIPIYKFKIFKDKSIRTNSEKFFKNTLSLPIYFELSKNQQSYVIKTIRKFFSK